MKLTSDLALVFCIILLIGFVVLAWKSPYNSQGFWIGVFGGAFVLIMGAIIYLLKKK